MNSHHQRILGNRAQLQGMSDGAIMLPMNSNDTTSCSFAHQAAINRHGFSLGIVLLLVLPLLAAVTIGGSFLLGSKAQERFNSLLEEGRLAVEKDRGDLALTAFTKAEAEINVHVKVYRSIMRFRGATFPTGEEVGELIVGAALIQAYERFFNLQKAPEIVKIAEERAGRLTSPEGAEMKRAVATAREVNGLVETLETKRYNDVMKGILAAEKNAQPTDQDFFVTEVRLLIACGKSMKEPAIVDHAREMLFFLAYEAGIKNKRIDQLWSLLGR